ncbi:glycosyltransferase family 4 protein [Alkalihalophilus lindianensis]|uniref:Glycosyltransferase family 4 protein n=1 Tax=Alkalihalophilus lindianensis TaxID=1630542 RepID=A0ABU3X951_9BACI|nr:glycosyltransferase family 4 protein [Alkalihalophilus lindianensis]MDV2684410.1 glycosyltransferase family 4 protein [Alkalihalophilus lindianensis]
MMDKPSRDLEWEKDMLGLFVHDHRFPKVESEYYHSYGFDEEFFNRYLSIFDKMAVIGREYNFKISSGDKAEKVQPDIEFLTILDLKQLKNKDIRDMINQKIKNSDYLVIRVPSILGLYAVRMAQQYKKPYLIEVVGCPWDAIANKGLTKIIPAAAITHLTKKAIRTSKYTVYVTEEFLERRYPTNGKYIACSNVTLNSVDDNFLSKRLEQIDKLEPNKIILGTCATVDVIYKGQQDVIAAIAKLKDEGYYIEYQLVGGGDTSYLKSIAQKYGVAEQVEFVGSLKHEDVFKWLEQIDIYVHPSKQEGLSRAIIEAMSKGCPIFGADAGGIHELIDDDYIFDKGNIQQIYDIFKSFNQKTMKEQAEENQKNSKKYLKSVLYKRRNGFFKEFIGENNI